MLVLPLLLKERLHSDLFPRLEEVSFMCISFFQRKDSFHQMMIIASCILFNKHCIIIIIIITNTLHRIASHNHSVPKPDENGR